MVIVGILLMILLGAFLLSAGCSESSTKTTPTSPATLPSIATAPTSPAMTPSLSMATDKIRYVSDELVNLTVTNSLVIPVWYIGYTQPDLVFWELERAQSNGWQRVYFRLPLTEGGKEVCEIRLYERPVGAVMEVKPHSDLRYGWGQKICPLKTMTGPFEPELVERGRYRFAFHYSLDTVKSENIETEPWKRPIELGETKIVYSNEFVLE